MVLASPIQQRERYISWAIPFAVASKCLESVENQNTGLVLYDFPQWIKRIDSQISRKTSVHGLAAVIKDKMSETFAFLPQVIASGAFDKDDACNGPLLIEYVVAGFEGAVPVLLSVYLEADWEKKTVGTPQLLSLCESAPTRCIGVGGATEAVKAYRDIKSDAFMHLRDDYLPKELSAYASNIPLTLNQATTIVGCFLEMEVNAEPKAVGFPLTIITIPKGGMAGMTATVLKGSRSLCSGRDDKAEQ